MKKKLNKVENGETSGINATNAEGKRLIAPRFPTIELVLSYKRLWNACLSKVQSSQQERFEVKLIQMNLISRVIGFHKLLPLSLLLVLSKVPSAASRTRDAVFGLCDSSLSLTWSRQT